MSFLVEVNQTFIYNKHMAKQKGPWQVKSTKTIYKNPWMKITEDKVLRPDGKDGIFGVVQMKPGVTILAIDSKNNVYLTEGYHYAVGRISLEAISGGIDKDETKLDAAKRELKEESGLVAGKWTYLGVIDPFTTVVTSPNHLYLAQDLGKGRKI